MTSRREAFRFCLVSAVTIALGSISLAETAPPSEPAAHALNLNLSDLKWERIIPELGDSTDRPLNHDSSTNALIRLYRTLKAANVTRSL